MLPSLSMVSYIAVDDAELPTVGCNVSCTTCDASDHSEWQELSTVDIQRIIEAKTNDDKKEKRKWQKKYAAAFTKEKRHVVSYLAPVAADGDASRRQIPFCVVPFPDESSDVYDEMVDDLATMRLREMGVTKFWANTQKVISDEVTNADYSLEGMVSVDEFYKKFLGNSVTHYLPEEWTVPREHTKMWFLPPALLDSILWDLKAYNGMEKIWGLFAERASTVSQTELKGNGRYRWFKPTSEASGTERTFLSWRTEAQLVNFKNEFVKSNLNIESEKEQESWQVVAGSVFTAGEPTFQNAHNDFKADINQDLWLIHIGIQKEGSVISVWDAHKVYHRYVHVPFGTFFAIRGDVWHSGFYGNPGNVRFHVIVSKNPVPAEEELQTLKESDAQYQLNASRPRCYKEFLSFHHAQSKPFVNAVTKILCERNQSKLGYSLDNLPTTVDLKRFTKLPVTSSPVPFPNLGAGGWSLKPRKRAKKESELNKGRL